MTISKRVRILIASLAVILTVVFGYFYWRYRQVLNISSFSQCAAAGFAVMESYPEVCRTSDGRLFVRQIDNQDITISGKLACLPHRNTSGPQTLECAFGLETNTGEYYALSDPDLKFLTSLSTGRKITVTGTLQTPSDSKYAVMGTILISQLSDR